ncbi:bifunctional hydroxymethylpyrimidine kinase/phosphomethylpyrimidine kinase [Pseudodesulfovibrio cashew]|uniref:hydroxymethylpyrimidine kinase n=1 Tax=Pseudodesulfovibrio cashew TaxID=2678688 RepID=A0A6I6JGT7_9BACT|nr:bifunctional hydroxymethylpyrimidine kinase/phosphomethylpyrimidine kinase [Pseudodesulfovibrio cashew]QGY41391.1 bifunctional hydroxymethylpyrimidine kinase/phosphomethylpyrimidine kinase [Pseudodesulfovibrio cashew]
MEKLPCILTIAGSDSGGGAGIQADIKAISMLGGYAASVITALTAQNTAAVTGIHAPSPKFVALQLRTVIEDIRVDAAKTGMLFSEPIIKAIAPILSRKTFPLVVDPVCVATSGSRLLKEDAVEAMKQLIFPHADLLTPNLPEAELFTGLRINDREDVFKAADLLLDMGPDAVLIKGGHSDSLAITDWYVAKGAEPIPFMQRRVDTSATHGTGCTLSSAIATGLGQGMEVGAAIKRAQAYLNLGLRAGYPLGEGGGPPNHLAPWLKAEARAGVLRDIDHLGRVLMAEPDAGRLLPRVRSNVAIALPFADGSSEVAGFTGGLIAGFKGRLMAVGYPEFGASVYTAASLLAARRLCPEASCAMTLAFTPPMERALEAVGVECSFIDRTRKPDYIGNLGGEFEEWGVFEALKDHARPESVRAVIDPGGTGCEPLVRVLGENAEDLRSRVERIFKSLREIV